MASHERAGHRAGTLGSPDAAEAHFHCAADLSTSEPDTTRLITQAAHMARQAGRNQDALVLYEQVVAAHRAAGRPRDAEEVEARRCTTLTLLGRAEESLQRLQRGLAALDDAAGPEVRGYFHYGLGQAHLYLGDAAAAGSRAAEAVRLLRLSGSPLLLTALNLHALVLVYGGDVTAAESAYLAAIQASRDSHRTKDEAVCRGNLADLLFHSDRITGAVEQGRAALALDRQLGDRRGQTINLSNLALLAYFTGDWAESARLADEAVDVAPDEHLRAVGRLPQVLLASAQGAAAEASARLADMAPMADSDDAQDAAALGAARAAAAIADHLPRAALAAAATAAEAALDAYGMRSEGFRIAWPLALEAALQAGDLDELERLLTVVRQAPANQATAYLRAQHRRYRALLDAAEGRTGDVEADLRSTLATLSDLGYPHWLARTRTDLARWLIGQHRPADAHLLLTEAVDAFTELGAQPDLAAASALLELALA